IPPSALYPHGHPHPISRLLPHRNSLLCKTRYLPSFPQTRYPDIKNHPPLAESAHASQSSAVRVQYESYRATALSLPFPDFDRTPHGGLPLPVLLKPMLRNWHKFPIDNKLPSCSEFVL